MPVASAELLNNCRVSVEDVPHLVVQPPVGSGWKALLGYYPQSVLRPPVFAVDIVLDCELTVFDCVEAKCIPFLCLHLDEIVPHGTDYPAEPAGVGMGKSQDKSPEHAETGN